MALSGQNVALLVAALTWLLSRLLPLRFTQCGATPSCWQPWRDYCGGRAVAEHYPRNTNGQLGAALAVAGARPARRVRGAGFGGHRQLAVSAGLAFRRGLSAQLPGGAGPDLIGPGGGLTAGEMAAVAATGAGGDALCRTRHPARRAECFRAGAAAEPARQPGRCRRDVGAGAAGLPGRDAGTAGRGLSTGCSARWRALCCGWSKSSVRARC